MRTDPLDLDEKTLPFEGHRMLQGIQRGIEALYRLDPAPIVTKFLIDSLEHSREQLLIVEEGDLYLGLQIAPAVLALDQDTLLAEANLDRFCLAVEGVSHYLFVNYRARRHQPTSAVELELQAEIDKYVASVLLARREPELRSRVLQRRLFGGLTLVEGLSDDERSRYQRAHRLARLYSRRLQERFVRRRRIPTMLRELRRFYRMGWRAKRDLIIALSG